MSLIESLLENLTPKQQDKLKQFREIVCDVLQPQHDDFYLLRWLKARNFDLTKSEEMLRKSLVWRKNYGTDELLSWDPPEILTKFWPGGIYGFDTLGHPIVWQISRDFDARGMMKSVKRSDVLKYHIWRMEKVNKLCEEQSEKLGRRISCAVHISDLSGFSLKMVFTPGITDVMKETFALIEANYPENLYASYVINAPGVFSVFFNIIRPFLSEDTKRKVHFLGRNWRERLLTDVALPEDIPVFWGGTAQDPDDRCTNHVNHGVKIPCEYYVRDRVSLDREHMTAVTIQRGKMFQLTFEVSKPETVIRWVFETEDFDVSFGIFYTPLVPSSRSSPERKKEARAKRSLVEVKPMSRVNCQQVPEDGNHRCFDAGQYVLKFDNSYSWVHGKKLFYEIELIEPTEDPMFEDFKGIEDDILETTRL